MRSANEVSDQSLELRLEARLPFFLIVYYLELEILSFSNPPKNAILSGKNTPQRFIFFKIFFDDNVKKPFIL